jgi:hypothetical protein
MRQLLPALSAEGLTGSRLARTAGRLAHARAALETAVADTLAETVMLHPAGFCLLDREKLFAAPPEIALRVLARVLRTVSGTAYPPRLENLEWLSGELSRPDARGRTLSGCRVLSWRGSLLVCREAAAASGKVPLVGGHAVWDGRFKIETRVEGDVFIGPVGPGARDRASFGVPCRRSPFVTGSLGPEGVACRSPCRISAGNPPRKATHPVQI